MLRNVKLLLPLIVLALIIAGCSGEKELTAPDMDRIAAAASQIVIPPGAVIESATFHIYVELSGNPIVDVHRITAAWDEYGVTYNSFGGAYDPTVYGSFTATRYEWPSVDVTALVNEWAAGTYDNFGLLLNQSDPVFPRSFYSSRETADAGPWMEICYRVGGVLMCDTVLADADTYINGYEGDRSTNYGADIVLSTGQQSETGPKKQTLVWFDMMVEPPVYAAIGDFVWEDLNENGIQDAGEPGVEGVVVHLMDCQGNILDEMLTDANGYYLFDMLTPGDYNIHFVLPAGYVFTGQDMGNDDAMDSDADMQTGLTICTTLEGGETDLTWDAGIYMPVMEGCTRTIGYWKNWGGFGPQDNVVSQYLPIWLGTAGGDKSIAVTDSVIAHDILTQKVYGKSNNGITKLYAQMLASKLNMAAGADVSVVADAFADADAFLADHDWMDWDSLSRQDKKMVNGWKDMFDKYNNGCIGPGHCDDDPYGEDCDD